MIIPDGRVVPGALEAYAILSLLNEAPDASSTKK